MPSDICAGLMGQPRASSADIEGYMHNKPRAFFGIYDEAKGVEESTTEGKREGEMN